ncbi:pre-60S ribosomal particles component [Friedmanniomyces endolithicus]|uniref:Pre-60S ribosomal particles component n=1 Tax=Friedmanniomyces endolithicus TaxID=329885 RepID=A0AAN6KCJ0_9PEZI|nr:pre-60S ribosomal particles component [Friedmanniomyces endolithicus]KAK0297862.1 pre-60S ribosomal particles component [Friedmanniomyces endolithicus]KAK0305693.1 pre-60S ribosomal particles component [Friedmanniomyces endolithicus]KAK0921440.1 pre-60S ribosomal particles component [Friedmanniomyces endolithicus]KAK0934730.1 pre-60S ribosomal particles component [Friedmanniomyces endolithicus]
MAPISKKRSREEKEPRRPKKKFKKVKPIDYHSSDDDSEVEGAAFDAPKEPKREKVIPVTGPNATPAAPRPEKEVVTVEAVEESKPKSILKQTPPGPEWVDDSPEPGDEEFTEVERNTAYNAIPSRDAAPFDPEAIITDQFLVDEVDGLEAAKEGLEADDDENDEPDLASSASSDNSGDEDSRDGDSIGDSATSSSVPRAQKKRNDPSAFATSITKILDTKLTTTKRVDPVLSRSKSASDANKTLADNKLEARARAQIRAERKAALDRGRVKDVLALETEGVETGGVLEEEKRLKKTAQRGVVKLFNAVRAAQVKGEQAMRDAKREGVVGMERRDERVSEMSKQGFLDLISAGGKNKGAVAA